MTTKIEKQKIKDEAKAELRKMLPPGSTVYTILRHVSRSGMFRVIEMVYHPLGGIAWVWPYKVEQAGFAEKRNKNDNGWNVGGCGMDMGFHLVMNLSYLLWGDGYPCLGKGCPSSFHQGKDYDNYTGEPIHKDGYALRQAWI